MPDSSDITTAYLGLGGNVGDPAAAMARALAMLDQHPDCRVSAVSRLYRTPPWGKTDQDWFFNAAASIETSLSPETLLGLALGIEQVSKRVRAERWGPRTLDIDILVYGDLAIRSEQLTIPHPRMTERAFVLMPLADIAPDLNIRGRKVREWLDEVDAAGIEVADERKDWWHQPQ
jgi:2-amino-4-hydroxy-6-hydroxymethyldihydropteridine diphosphokinase